ncbi:UvrB/UvrC motif-containing protein [Sphingomonas solaris]|uniref:Excinuclease ABC subunit B n=1 Tax=Alterirhizorhabdus solaris TaxID=2529389 RepID=A0A558QRW2_9SPHN|nr:UvrB/UvrC motif-containing protein [Sphingomonas solaris]TVV69886.1 excinuclease ABC subunit B [Sphingomonas solaris]
MDDAAIAALERAMADAAASGDYERAAILRDQIHAARNGGTPVETGSGLAGLTRQQPGAMGLGTSQQRAEPPPGWVRPKKPDPMTRGTSRRKRA